MTKARTWCNANIFFPLCTQSQTPQHSLCWHAGPLKYQKICVLNPSPRTDHKLFSLSSNRFCISHESTDLFPVVLLLLKFNGLIWKWLMSVSEYVLCLLWNWISFALHSFLYKFKVYKFLLYIQGHFLSLNRVAQVGLRQEIKNVL